MSRPSHDIASEFEQEYEAEFEDEGEVESEWEDEAEDEAFLGALGGIARSVGSLLGGGEGEDEWELEDESEWEYEDEAEDEDFLGALGGIARSVGGLLGEGEAEDEAEDEAEEFFKRIGSAFRKAAPFLRVLAKTAGPLIATAVGGPAAGALARVVTSQLEGETEDEVEAELEDMATAPIPGAQAMGEYFAAQAAAAESEAEAEAFSGVAAYVSLSARDRRALEQMLPALLRGAAAITRLLRTDRRTQPGIRMIPGIVDAAGRTIARRIEAGQPVGPADVGHVLGAATRRVLVAGPARDAVMRRHARGLSHVHRHRGYRRVPGHLRSRGRRHYRLPVGQRTLYRTPVRSRVTSGGPVARPRPGFVRVVTPVRVPATADRGPRTVRVVTDVRVPRGAVAAGRPVTVGTRRRTR